MFIGQGQGKRFGFITIRHSFFLNWRYDAGHMGPEHASREKKLPIGIFIFYFCA